VNDEREQALRDVLEQTAADLKILSLTIDTVSFGLDWERVEPQATAALKAIRMGISYVQQNIDHILKTEQRT
jgi:hypothetical protein